MPKLTYMCPVCGYGEMPTPLADDAICYCCGTHFGYDDTSLTYEELRHEWLSHGAKWFHPTVMPPTSWNATDQLLRSGVGVSIDHKATTSVTLHFSAFEAVDSFSVFYPSWATA